MKLLGRDGFRTAVFHRDGGICVCCGEEAVDAHHILERRLFSDGGYYLANGAALCSACHLEAECTLISPEEIRRAAGIHEVLLPPGFPAGLAYDKWGNPCLSDGRRRRGPLFSDPGVRKVLYQAGVMARFAWDLEPFEPRR